MLEETSRLRLAPEPKTWSVMASVSSHTKPVILSSQSNFVIQQCQQTASAVFEKIPTQITVPKACSGLYPYYFFLEYLNFLLFPTQS